MSENSELRLAKGTYAQAAITRIEPALKAAFVDFGEERHGLLPLSTQQLDELKKGNQIVIQIEKPAFEDKGATVRLCQQVPEGVDVKQLVNFERYQRSGKSRIPLAILTVFALAALYVFWGLQA